MRDTTGETWVVRIYRRDPADPARLSGIVESVERDHRYAFDNMKVLTEILGGKLLPRSPRLVAPGKD